MTADLKEFGHFDPIWRERADFIISGMTDDEFAVSEETDDRFLVQRVVERSGRFVFRVWFDRPAIKGHAEAIEGVRALGGLVEVYSSGISGYLRDREAAGVLEYETGRR